jgi:hypothetical protein
LAEDFSGERLLEHQAQRDGMRLELERVMNEFDEARLALAEAQANLTFWKAIATKNDGLVRAEVDSRGVRAEVQAAGLVVLAAECRSILRSSNAPNYVELTLEDDLGRLIVNVRKAEGKTPQDLLGEARAELERLRPAAADLTHILALFAAGSWSCDHCAEPATCFGGYEGSDSPGFSCDEHCGHGCEDGWCIRIPEVFDDEQPCERCGATNWQEADHTLLCGGCGHEPVPVRSEGCACKGCLAAEMGGPH